MSGAPPTPGSQIGNTVTTNAKPVQFSSPKDLENEIVSLLSVYTEKEGEANWMKREKVLLRFRGLLISGAGLDHSFQVAIKRIIPAISESMLSLRTQLSMQAIYLAGDLAHSLKNEFIPYSDAFSQVILKLFSQTKKILATTGSEVMFKMIESFENQKLIATFSATLGDKNKDVRIKGSEVIKKMLEHWSAESFGKNDLAVEKAFRLGLQDATPQVRETIRSAFWLYSALCPSRAPILLKSLDGATRKHLDKVRPKDIVLPEEDDVSSPSESTPQSTSPVQSTIVQAKLAFIESRNQAEGNEEVVAPKSPESELRSKLTTFAFDEEQQSTPEQKEKQKEKAPSTMAFEINFAESEPMEEDGYLQPTPTKIPATSSSTKSESSPSPLVKTKPAPSQVENPPKETSPDQATRDLSSSSTLSSWQKAEIEEEPWEEVNIEPEEVPQLPVPKMPETPKKGINPLENKENKENLRTPNRTPMMSLQKEMFLTPSVLKFRDYPRTPSTASPNFDWEEALPVMLAQLEAGTMRDDTFRKLARLSRNNLDGVWKVNFQTIYRLSSRFLLSGTSTDTLQKEKCLDLLKEMLCFQKDHFAGKEEEVLRLLLKIEKDSSPSMRYAAWNALSSMALNLPLRGLYDLWTRWLAQRPQESEMKVLFSLLPKILSRFASSKSSQLVDSLPQLSQDLIQELQTNTSSQIRRSVVESIIEIQLATDGHVFGAHFGGLGVQQRKLVEIYMRKHPSVASKSLGVVDHDED